MKTISVARLREVLNYDPETGIFTRREKHCRKVRVGEVAGSVSPTGYVIVRLFNRNYRAHRLALAYVEGCFPQGEVDHINRVRSDNRYANLRHATRLENAQNTTKNSLNQCGLAGVRLTKSQRWSAQIGLNRKQKHLGTFDTPQEAHAAYLAAKASLHTFHPVPL